jgi:hypothetical protein
MQNRVLHFLKAEPGNKKKPFAGTATIAGGLSNVLICSAKQIIINQKMVAGDLSLKNDTTGCA